MLLLMLTLEKGVRIGFFLQNSSKNTQKSHKTFVPRVVDRLTHQNEIKPYQETKKKVKRLQNGPLRSVHVKTLD